MSVVSSGIVNDFRWSEISSPQYVNTPIAVTLTAEDLEGNTVTDFHGSIELGGWMPATETTVFREDFEDGDYDGWIDGSGDGTRAVTGEIAAAGDYSFTIIGNSEHNQGVLHELDDLAPERIEFSVRSNSASRHDGYFVLGKGSRVAQSTVWFRMGKDGTMGVMDYQYQFHSTPYAADRWYRISFVMDWHAKRFDYYVDGQLIDGGISFRGPSVQDLNSLYLYNFSEASQAWWDEITLIDVAPARPIEVMPLGSVDFVDGVWTGQVMVLEETSGMVLRAENVSGNFVESDPFEVRALSDEVYGTKFNDLDGDGVWDTYEEGLEGWQIYLDLNENGQHDLGEPYDVTDADGNYRIQTAPGVFTVAEVPQDGWQQTFPADNLTHTAIVPAGQFSFPLHFGNRRSPGQIHGTIFNDLNGNGARDDDPGLPDWKIYLDENLNGQWDDGEPYDLTDANGEYAFTGLAPGAYMVAEVPQDGWQQTYPGGADPASASATSLGVWQVSEASDDSYAAISTTSSTAPVYLPSEETLLAETGIVEPSTTKSAPLIRLDEFREDPRFAGIDGSGAAVAILDTGMDLDHRYFGPDSDGDGIADRVVYQYDFGDDDDDAGDYHGHGTNVTSIIASQDETYTGMAPSVDIIHLKVFPDSGEGGFDKIEKALKWVLANIETYNIVAVNLSLGDGENNNRPRTRYGIGDELAALVARDVIVSAASGNDFNTYESVQGVAYPAADPNTLAVGAVYDTIGGPYSYSTGAKAYSAAPDRVAAFSQRHEQLTTVMAPGAPITGAGLDGKILTKHGTSQAAAHVSGIAVLAQELAVRNLGRRLTVAEFRSLLVETAVTVNDGDDEDDNVTNTGLDFPRVDMMALAEAIYDLAQLHETHTVVLGSGQVVGGIDFGNWRQQTSPPGAPDLEAAYDTGEHNDDDLTMLDNDGLAEVLEFSVGGTLPGATVTLYADGHAIGTAVATGQQTTVATGGSYDLSDGLHAITARQAMPGQPESDHSPALEITVDTMGPNVTVDVLATTDPTPAITGTVDDAEAAVELTVDGITYLADSHDGDGWLLADDGIDPELAAGVYDVAAVATDLAGNFGIDGTLDELTIHSFVAGRYVFYNDSVFDRYAPQSNADDDQAVALDKQALLPRETATFANYTSYAVGINGIMVDVANLAATPTLADFEFRLGKDEEPDGWQLAPTPRELTLRRGAGTGGSDRITIIWDDHAVEKQWLQVRVLATAQTGLADDDVFYFGNAIGESGNSSVDAMVTSVDEIGARSNARLFGSPDVEDPYDFNRDGMVSAVDQIIARHNIAAFDALPLISPPVGTRVDENTLHAPTAVVSGESEILFLPDRDLVAESGGTTWPKRPSTDVVDQLLATYWP